MRSAEKTGTKMGLPISRRGASGIDLGGAARMPVAALVVLAAAVTGCASQAPAVSGSEVSPPAPQISAQRSDAALDNLWHQRMTEQKDFPVGPGDMLDVSVTNVRELKDQTVRVDGKGDISLPLLGTLHVAGETEPEIIDQLANALHKYAYHPQVSVSAKSYSSRVVGVMGAVRTPGLYVLNGPADTVRDLIERAGGLTDSGAHEVLLSVARPGSNADSIAAQGDASGPATPTQADVASATLGSIDNSSEQAAGLVTTTALKNDYTPSVRPLTETDFDRSSAYSIALDADSPYRKYVNLPVRPGDTLFVPPAGQVSVIGWVSKPVVLPVVHGLTVLGAVSAAGGMLYAADPTTVKVRRHEAGEQTKVIEVNLAAVQDGKAQDVALQANDVVDVGYSTAKIPGYALYYAAQGFVSMAPAAALVGGL